MKIMIVDDHEDMRRTLRNYIALSQIEPLEFTECESGEDAIEQYNKLLPDFVLMDIELKTLNGFEVTEKILKQDPKAKVIIITSYDTPGFRKKAEKIGANAFVSKDKLSDLKTILNLQQAH